MPFLNFFPPMRTAPALGGWVAAWILMGLPLSASAQDGPAIVAALEDSFTKIFEAAEPSVVSIARIGRPANFTTDRTGENLNPNTPSANPEDFIPSEFGAGVIFEPPDQPGQRLILTMYHVVKGGKIAGRDDPGGDELLIRTSKRQKARVEIIAADPRSDLAVLRIRPNEPIKASDLKPIPIAEAPKYKKGQFVLTLGNPYAIARDGSACAGWGMISNIARAPKPIAPGLDAREKMRRETLHHQGTLLQIDGQLNLGASGGAVLNRQGELIGIITAMAALEGYEKSTGYAVPLNKGIQRIVAELAHGYEAEYGFLGVIPETVPFPIGDQPTAVKAEPTNNQSPAAQAGVKLDDVIYAVDGVTVYTQEDLMREIALIAPGERAKLELYRPHTRQWLTKVVTLAKWPVLNEEELIATEHRHVLMTMLNNIVIDHATARYGPFNVHPYFPAVLVTKVLPKTPEQPEPLREGDFITHIDGKPVRSPEEFQAAVQAKTPGSSVKLQLVNRNRPITVRIPE